MTTPKLPLNRRRFLQAIAAAGLAPVLPAMPISAAPIPSGATPAQLLWKGLYAKGAGDAQIAGITKTMGISQQAAYGVHAKLVGAKVLAAHSAGQIGRAARRAIPTPAKGAAPISGSPKTVRINVKKLLLDDLDQEGEPQPSDDTDDRQVAQTPPLTHS